MQEIPGRIVINRIISDPVYAEIDTHPGERYAAMIAETVDQVQHALEHGHLPV